MKHERNIRALAAAAVIVVALLALAACSSPASTGGTTSGATAGGSGASSGSGGGGGGATTVVEQNYQFSPSSVTVALGSTVTFDNKDTVPHHVVVGTKDLGVQQPGASVTWTADTDGTFSVKCLIHPSMAGQVTAGSGGTTGGSSAPAPAPSTAPPSGGYGY